MLFDRTLHPDEANQAFTTGRLLESGSYVYRPSDHHGPTLYYAAAALQKAAGHSDTASLDATLLRCTPLLFGVLALGLIAHAVFRLVSHRPAESDAPRTGRALLAGGMAVLLLGTSPLLAFFATDFIQETLLTCFLALMFWAGTGYWLSLRRAADPTPEGERPRRRLKPGSWALLFGIGAGLSFATKETCVLSFAALTAAAAPFLWRAWRTRGEAASVRRRTGSDVVLGILAFLLTGCVLFSSFGANWHGVVDAFVNAPLSYLHRAAGDAAAGGADGHVHPWWQYLQWLFAGTPEGLFSNMHVALHLLLLLPLGILAATNRLRAYRPGPLPKVFLGVSAYPLLLLLFYSAIPYKTPWCAVQILAGLLLAAVLGYALLADVLVDVLRARGARASRVKLAVFLSLVFLPGCVVLRAHLPGLRKICAEPDSAAIPYNYAHASPEAQELASCVDAAMRAAPGEPFVAVVLPPEDTWPFPWYNRPWESRTGYWTTMDELVALAEHGSKPTVVVVPMRDGHLVQPLFPHLRHTKRFYMRPKIPERGVVGTRVRVFW